MGMRLKYLWILLLLIPNVVWGACTGSSPNWTTTADQSSFDTCVSNASDGDTITFPSSGSATWSTESTISKALTINGNGTTLTKGANLVYGFFNPSGVNSTNTLRITGFTFQMVDSSCYTAVRSITNPSLKIRIDHNTFHNGGVQMEIGGAKGVIDNNYFYNGSTALYLGAGTRAQADADWADLAMGTSNALFIEDNHFIINADVKFAYNQIIDETAGGKFVIRYNTFDVTADSKTTGLQYIYQNHGNMSGYWQNDSGARRGPSTNEFYNNTIAGKNIGRFYTDRGGAALVYNNTVTSVTYNPGVVLYEEEGSLTSQFSPSRTEWPAEDQIHNTFFWNNKSNGIQLNSAPSTYFATTSSTFIQINRDFFAHKPCGASDSVDAYGNTCTHGKATFTGANGASDSYPTDGNTYPTEGTMVFTSTGDNAYYGYVPYTYPHPLRGETVATNYSISGGTISGGSIK
jgi:hypothetical protein